MTGPARFDGRSEPACQARKFPIGYSEEVVRPTQARGLLRILWLLAVLIVVTGSLLPADSPPMRALSQLHLSDKFEHVVAYAVLACLPATHERRRVVVAAAIGAVALGVALEYLQLYSGWRDFEVGDMIADAAGAACGLAAASPLRSSVFFRRLIE